MSYRESRGSFGTSAGSAHRVKPSIYGNEFIRLSKVIGNNIGKIQNNVRQMKTMLKDLETKPDDRMKQSRLHSVQQKTNTLVKDTGKYLQDLNKSLLSSDVQEKRHQKIQRERLVGEFSKALDEFQEVQKQEKEKVKARVAQDRKSLGMSEDLTVDFSRQGDQAVIGAGQLVLQIDASDVDLELMRERERALQKLEEEICDVAQIFTQLNEMVHEQGDVVDSIEKNVEEAAASIEQGKEDLAVASIHQTSARKKKCTIIIVVVVIVVIIIVIILASTLSKK